MAAVVGSSSAWWLLPRPVVGPSPLWRPSAESRGPLGRPLRRLRSRVLRHRRAAPDRERRSLGGPLQLQPVLHAYERRGPHRPRPPSGPDRGHHRALLHQQFPESLRRHKVAEIDTFPAGHAPVLAGTVGDHGRARRGRRRGRSCRCPRPRDESSPSSGISPGTGGSWPPAPPVTGSSVSGFSVASCCSRCVGTDLAVERPPAPERWLWWCGVWAAPRPSGPQTAAGIGLVATTGVFAAVASFGAHQTFSRSDLAYYRTF